MCEEVKLKIESKLIIILIISIFCMTFAYSITKIYQFKHEMKLAKLKYENYKCEEIIENHILNKGGH